MQLLDVTTSPNTNLLVRAWVSWELERLLVPLQVSPVYCLKSEVANILQTVTIISTATISHSGTGTGTGISTSHGTATTPTPTPGPCSADLLTDPLNCGACGVVCPSGTCSNGVCSSDLCNAQVCGGFTNCNPKNVSSSCSSHLLWHSTNCHLHRPNASASAPSRLPPMM